MDDSIEEAKNMKLILTTFEHLSGLKITYHKSGLYCFGDAKCRIGMWVFTVLKSLKLPSLI